MRCTCRRSRGRRNWYKRFELYHGKNQIFSVVFHLRRWAWEAEIKEMTHGYRYSHVTLGTVSFWRSEFP